MKTIDKVLVVVVVVLVGAMLIYLPALSRSLRRAKTVNAINILKISYRDITNGSPIKTNWSGQVRVFIHTNRYTIAGSNYYCVLAADSWDDRGARNLLAITTNEALLFIGERGTVPLIGSRLPPGY